MKRIRKTEITSDDRELGATALSSMEDLRLPPTLEEMERGHIIKVLDYVNYNKARASRVLGIDRATLYRKAQRHGIDLRGR